MPVKWSVCLSSCKIVVCLSNGHVCHMYLSLLGTSLGLLIVSSACIEKVFFSNLSFTKWMKISNFQVSGMQVALFYFKRKY